MPPRRAATPQPKIPEAMQACQDGWEEISRSDHPFQLMSEDDFESDFLFASVVESYVQYAEKEIPGSTQ